jgi:hypothetical protein
MISTVLLLVGWYSIGNVIASAAFINIALFLAFGVRRSVFGFIR